jgi:alpha-L-fucosidase
VKVFVLAVLLAGRCFAQTTTQYPVVIDNIWQKANSKYDGARQAILKQVDDQANDGPFQPNWKLLQNHHPPQWYQDAKFGIFIHWGLYSVPAFANEWCSRNMYQQNSPEFAHHVATHGPQNKVGYKDFIPMFKAEHFDPREWARLFPGFP